MQLIKELTSIMRPQMMKFVGQNFDQGVQNAPRLIARYLGQDLGDEAFDAERFDFRVNEQSGVCFHQSRRQSHVCLALSTHAHDFRDYSVNETHFGVDG